MAAPRQSHGIISGEQSIGDWTPEQLRSFITNLLHVEPWTLPTGLNLKTVAVSEQLTLGDDGSEVGFFGTSPTTKPTVTGSKGANAALTSLLAALVELGLVKDTTS